MLLGGMVVEHLVSVKRNRQQRLPGPDACSFACWRNLSDSSILVDWLSISYRAASGICRFESLRIAGARSATKEFLQHMAVSPPASGLVRREDVRNIAIIAHVDHGKTTLVDGMLKQSRVFRDNQAVGSLIMDSNALEREKGITILAKNTAILYKQTRINVIDTPGHADFSGEVERVLNMADGCLLLVDAVDGPMPQTRFVLRKALDLGLQPIVVVNKIDRPNNRIMKVVEETQDLFLDLATHADQLVFPVVFTNARDGTATLDPDSPGTDLGPLFETIIHSIPAPLGNPDGGFQLLVANIYYDDYVGRSAVGRIARGRVHPTDPLVRIDRECRSVAVKPGQVLAFEGLKRVPLEEGRAGDIVVLTGLEGIEIGDTVASPDFPEALPRIEIEEPTVRLSLGVNTSPMGGKEGKFSTTRQIRARLYRELETNIALRVDDTDAADVSSVSGRGELHLAILLETLRREGYEFEVSRPEVITKSIGGQVNEPVESLTVETTELHVGAVTENLGRRLARMTNLHNDGKGTVRIEYRIPTRGLIGFRSTFLTLTRGEGLMGSVMVGYEPWYGDLGSLRMGAIVATDSGTSTAFGLAVAQGRGSTFIEPGTRVYEGMVVGLGKYPREDTINVCKEKKLTNMRAASADIAVRLTPPVKFSLEESLDFLEDDELLEVTPKSLRLRKRFLSRHDRARVRGKALTSAEDDE
jgi:GTP-binding protein